MVGVLTALALCLASAGDARADHVLPSGMSARAAALGHESGMAPDGRTFYSASP